MKARIISADLSDCNKLGFETLRNDSPPSDAKRMSGSPIETTKSRPMLWDDELRYDMDVGIPFREEGAFDVVPVAFQPGFHQRWRSRHLEAGKGSGIGSVFIITDF